MKNTNRLEPKSFIVRRIITLGTIFVFTSIAANAEEDSTKPTVYEEVLVTAQKREEKLIDIPMSISVVTDESISRYQIKNMVDLSYYVPGMAASSSEASKQNISIRGVSNIQGTAPITGIYLDEIPLSFAPSTAIDLQTTDIQRVEVLKGPQGTLFGQGSINGTVRFISKKPSFDSINGGVQLSTYNTEGGDSSSELTAIVNLPILSDKLGFRFVTTTKDVGGWIDQPTTNTDNANDNELKYTHAKGLWKPTEKLTIDAQVIRYDLNAGAPNIANIGSAYDSMYHVTIRNNFVPSTDTDYSYDIFNLTLNYDFDFATFVSSSSKIASENISHSVTSITETLTGPPMENLTLGISSDVDSFAQEFRLNGKNEKLDWVAGVFFTDIELENSFDNFVAYIGDTVVAQSPGITTYGDTKSIAYFIDLSYDISERIAISAGTRYYEDEKSSSLSVGGTVTDPADSNFHKLSSKFSLTYSMTELINLYLRVSEGFRSGGSNNFGQRAYEPESLLNYELGFKSTLLEGRLNAEASIFLSQYKDYQEVELDPITNQFILLNPGEAEVKGIEWATQLNITKQFTVGFSGHVSESEFTNLNSGVFSKNVGDELNYAPKYSYSLTANYNFNWFTSTPGYFQVGYNRQGKQSLISRPFIIESSELGYLSAQIGMKIAGFSVSAFGRNLTNEIRTTAPRFSNNLIPNRPRTYGLQINYEF